MIALTHNRVPAIILTALFAAIFFLPQSAFAIDIQRVKSPGGIEAWLVRDTSVPVISFSVAFVFCFLFVLLWF